MGGLLKHFMLEKIFPNEIYFQKVYKIFGQYAYLITNAESYNSLKLYDNIEIFGRK